MSLMSHARLAAPALVLAISLLGRSSAAADNALSTPVLPTLVAASPSPAPPPSTVLANTPVLPTSTPAAAIAVEGSTPIATSPPPPTAQPTVAPVATNADTLPTATSVPATPSVRSMVGVQPAEAPLPSPAELRMDARLRWGDGVPSQVRRWAYLIVPAAHKYHLNPNLIAAVMTMESNGDPLALSGSDARGLMQILHGPWDPAANIDTGAHMLAALYSQFGSWPLALAGYNAGPGAVLAYDGIPPYRETRDYVIIVSYLYDLFDHHLLSAQRRTQYRSTVADLRHFAGQRKKVARLAQIAHVTIDRALACHHFSAGCGAPQQPPLSSDPFWPVPSGPDPLQRVDPYAHGGQ